MQLSQRQVLSLLNSMALDFYTNDFKNAFIFLYANGKDKR